MRINVDARSEERRASWARLGLVALGWTGLGSFGQALLVDVKVRLCVWIVMCVSEK